MFTIKMRSYSLSRTQKEGSDQLFYDENEQINGPFDLISKEQDADGYTVVHCHHGDAPAITYKDTSIGRDEVAGSTLPRSTLWVMNDQGATVAKYDL